VTRLALSNLGQRRMRTALSVLAVAVEVALVLVLVGLTTGTLQEVGDRIENVHSDVLVLPPGAQLILAMSNAVMPLDPVRAAIEATPGVQAAAPVVFATTNRFGGYAMIFGIEPRSYALAGRGALEVLEGEGIHGADDLLVDRRLARANQLAVGQQVEILNHSFRIAGIVRDGAGVRMYLPIGTVQDLLGRQGKASLFFVRTTAPDRVAAVVDELRRSPAFKGYNVIASRQYAELLGTSAFGIRQFIAAVTVIAVLFGFLVISLAMYTTIIERTRQIGILKTMGAGRGFIVRAIVLEAGLLVALGIPTGFVLAVVVKALLQATYPTLIIFLTPRWLGYASALAFGAGLLGALYPALRAARVDPVVALSYE
jgi:putative ABC transport system permease protein